MKREVLTEAIDHPNVRAWLRVIRAGETSQDDVAYRTMFGGGLFDEWKHPRKVVSAAGLLSTAAGAYQFLSKTWDECAQALDLPDFSPASQDLAALFLTFRRGALQDVIDGRIEVAIAKCCREWASLPGSPYGQPTRTMAQALDTYKAFGGTLFATEPIEIPDIPPGEAPDWVPPQPKGPAMDPFTLAGAVKLASVIPRLWEMFGTSDSAKRNAKAADVVVKTVTEALGVPNVQTAVEKIQQDPSALAVASKAVEVNWLNITEAGGGGMEGARKADAVAQAEGNIRKSPSFWIALILIPLVYILVLSLVGLIGTATWSDDVRAGLAGSLISAIVGGLVGYYYGQSTSRNRSAA